MDLPVAVAMQPTDPPPVKHRGWVRAAHWMVTISFLLLTFSGAEILMVHPRFYWGETGNDLTPALFELPVSRNYKHGGWQKPTPFFNKAGSPVSARRTYEIFNKNGWGRSLHFLAAWVLVLTGIWYLLTGILSGHFKRHLSPRKKELSAGLFRKDFMNHQGRLPVAASGQHYGLLQKYTYITVIFFLLPLTAITGLTMSPAVTAAYPFLLKIFAGVQSARTIHFFAAVSLVLFLAVHITMVIRSGFKQQLRGIILGK